MLELEDHDGAPVLLNVYGGKITTFRKLAEQAVDRLAASLGNSAGPWTEAAHLPGGDIAEADFEAFLDRQRELYPWLPEALRLRYARNYGTRMDRLLDGRSSLSDLGEDFGAALFAAEVDHLVDLEFARSADDILWRRSKLGLRMSKDDIARLQAYLAARSQSAAGSGEEVGAVGL